MNGTEPNEPTVTTAALVTGAINSTLAVLLFLGVKPELVAALTLASNGWIAVAARMIHKRTTPTDQVALTHADVEKLAGPDEPILGHRSALTKPPRSV